MPAGIAAVANRPRPATGEGRTSPWGRLSGTPPSNPPRSNVSRAAPPAAAASARTARPRAAVTAGSTTTRPRTISHGTSRNGPGRRTPVQAAVGGERPGHRDARDEPDRRAQQRPDQADHHGVRRSDPAPGARRGAHSRERGEVGPRVGERQEGGGQGAAEHQDAAEGEQDDLGDHRRVVGHVAALDVQRRGLRDRGQGLVGGLLLLLGHVPGDGQRDGRRLGAQLLGRRGGDDGGRTGPRVGQRRRTRPAPSRGGSRCPRRCPGRRGAGPRSRCPRRPSGRERRTRPCRPASASARRGGRRAGPPRGDRRAGCRRRP